MNYMTSEKNTFTLNYITPTTNDAQKLKNRVHSTEWGDKRKSSI